ncbi:hypothetical protein VP1G_05007 [Cytospora mali]|uniref:Uncharacterized protein n=1 Tax=Cytospora mali TaxID=578113 RepID=A0A194V1A0_CYTMA|nr:hypothetical protein VP1G_05007 [Valsa mali var. pyri (nom. inval.)]
MSSMEDDQDHQGDGQVYKLRIITDASLGPVLPGCSKGKDHSKKWNMSTTMMQVYFAMKGPGVDMEDPLVNWIGKHEVDKQQNGEATLLGGVEDSINERGEWKARGPATVDEDDEKRKAIFSYARPKMDHLTVDESFDPDKLEEMYQNLDKQGDGWAKYAASEISNDGEGDPVSGRVSPCTFARWALGAKRWDAPGDKYKSMWEERENYDIPEDRQRPASPNTALPRREKDRKKERLYDAEDGRELSPACSGYAKTEPSVLWSPPPMDPSLPYNFFTHQFDRMDPMLMREVRKNNASTEPSWGVSSASQPEHYTPSEVDAAVEKYWGAARTTGIIASHHHHLASLRAGEERANAANELYRHECRRLKHENRRLADCLEARRSTRERRIMKNVQRHISELNYECKAKMAEVKARMREHENLLREYQVHIGVQQRLLGEFGKETPEEVFEMYPDIWESEEERKNRRNFS